jgi:putative proteasome-type protease
MRSNVTVGPPIDLLAYSTDELDITRRRRFTADDPDLVKIGTRWEQALRMAVGKLPELRFRTEATSDRPGETIQVVETGGGEPQEQQPQATQRSSS